jgi:hypothetical protein
MDDKEHYHILSYLCYQNTPSEAAKYVLGKNCDARKNWKKKAEKFHLKYVKHGNGEQTPMLLNKRRITGAEVIVPTKSQLLDIWKQYENFYEIF